MPQSFIWTDQIRDSNSNDEEFLEKYASRRWRMLHFVKRDLWFEQSESKGVAQITTDRSSAADAIRQDSLHEGLNASTEKVIP